jgi:release factor glutamine methyltransferase
MCCAPAVLHSSPDWQSWLAELTGKARYDNFRLGGCDVRSSRHAERFNPKVPRTGAFLAAQLDSRWWAAMRSRHGNRIRSVWHIAAKHARRVVAVDINVAAVRCAAINAALNHVDHRVEVRHGDLFAPVAGERFDLILFNPPFLRGTPRDDRDCAWRSSDVAERFAAALPEHLKPGGSALVVLSTFGEAWLFLEEFRKRGFAISVLAERRFINERLAIFRLAPASPGDAA